jgi:hypothetical protein
MIMTGQMLGVKVTLQPTIGMVCIFSILGHRHPLSIRYGEKPARELYV